MSTPRINSEEHLSIIAQQKEYELEKQRAYLSLTKAFNGDNGDKVVSILQDYFSDDINTILYYLECAAYDKKNDVLDAIVWQAMENKTITKIITLAVQKNLVVCIEACLNHIPNVASILHIDMDEIVICKDLPYGCLALLYQHKCISWEENNKLYYHLASHILNSDPITNECKEVCHLCYNLANSTTRLRRTYAHDALSKLVNGN